MSSSAVQQGECLTGFRFEPNDSELINYLFNYIYKDQRLNGIIHEINIYDHHPDELGSMFNHGIEGKMYFFNPTEKKYQQGQQKQRLVGGGPAFWKNTNKGVDVECSNGIVGIKTPFSFREGKKQKSIGSIMYEYRLKDVPRHAGNGNQMKMDETTLCIIYKHLRGSCHPSEVIIDGSDQPPRASLATASPWHHGDFNMDSPYDPDGDWERHLHGY